MDTQINAEFFEKALAEAGLKNANVTHFREAMPPSEVFRVEKRVGDEKIVAQQKITDAEMQQLDDVKQHVATLATQTARGFDERTTEDHEWGENAVRIDLVDDYDAECLRCGERVSMDALRPTVRAETAVPQPTTSGYESLPDTKIRMTLLALLRDACKDWCPNAPKDLSTRRP